MGHIVHCCVQGLEVLQRSILASLNEFPVGWPRRAIMIGVPLFVVVYAFIFRTYDISHHFWFQGDQQRDWSLVQGDFLSLPVTGTPIATGGVSFGPIFYWILWGLRQVLVPVFGNLPHIGAIGLVILRVMADGVLVFALLRRQLPVMAVAGFMLLLTSSPFEGALSATIWNPVLAVTLANISIAVLLLSPHRQGFSLIRIAVMTGTSWLAVQAHTPAIFLAVAIGIYSVWAGDCQTERRWKARLYAAGVGMVIVVVLQIPYAIHVLGQPDMYRESVFVRTGGLVFTNLSFIGFGESLSFLIRATERIILLPTIVPVLGVAFVVGAGFTGYTYRRNLDFIAVSILPAGLAWIGYAVMPYEGDVYWLLSLIFPLSFVLLGGIMGMNGACEGSDQVASRPVVSSHYRRLAVVTIVGMVLFGLVTQPGRWVAFDTLFKAPQYGPVVAGVQSVLKSGRPITSFRGADAAAAAMNPELLYRLLGGTLASQADQAVVNAVGVVVFEQQ